MFFLYCTPIRFFFFFLVQMLFNQSIHNGISRYVIACMPLYMMSHSYCLLFLCCTALFTNLIGFTVWLIDSPPHVLISDLFSCDFFDFKMCLRFCFLFFLKGCFESFVLFLASMVRQWQFYFWINLLNIPWLSCGLFFLLFTLEAGTMPQLFLEYSYSYVLNSSQCNKILK